MKRFWRPTWCVVNFYLLLFWLKMSQYCFKVYNTYFGFILTCCWDNILLNFLRKWKMCIQISGQALIAIAVAAGVAVWPVHCLELWKSTKQTKNMHPQYNSNNIAFANRPWLTLGIAGRLRAMLIMLMLLLLLFLLGARQVCACILMVAIKISMHC